MIVGGENCSRPSLPLSTSVRSRSLVETLELAKPLADTLGIVRVFEITRLDAIGIPVFAAVRPTAATLCVNAGKGCTVEEARVSAFMEAIEFAIADRELLMACPEQLSNLDLADSTGFRISDYCPRLGIEVAADERITCVGAESVLDGGVVMIPAEAVFLTHPASFGRRLLGNGSVGLASGNTLIEASVHAALEVIERDIQSFQAVRDTSILINTDTAPDHIRGLAESCRSAGHALALSFVESGFGLSYFSATLLDPDPSRIIRMFGGYGCHPDPVIAATRAICEAAQSRLSFIHGARDDLSVGWRHWNDATEQRRNDSVRNFMLRLKLSPSAPFPSASPELPYSPEHLWQHVCSSIIRMGFTKILRYRYAMPNEGLHVVRIVIPRAEHFNQLSPRLGRRLRDYARAT